MLRNRPVTSFAAEWYEMFMMGKNTKMKYII